MREMFEEIATERETAARSAFDVGLGALGIAMAFGTHAPFKRKRFEGAEPKRVAPPAAPKDRSKAKAARKARKARQRAHA